MAGREERVGDVMVDFFDQGASNNGSEFFVKDSLEQSLEAVEDDTGLENNSNSKPSSSAGSDDDLGSGERGGGDSGDLDGASETKKVSSEGEKGSKTVAVKLGDESLEYSLDAKIPVAIDGKEEVFTLRELRNLKSGERSYNRKFTELGEQKKALAQQQSELGAKYANAEQVTEAMKKGDTDAALTLLAIDAGMDPVDFWNKFHQGFSQYFLEYNSLSDDEKKLVAGKRELALKEIQINRAQNKVSHAENNQKVEAAREKIRGETGLSDEQISAGWDKLAALANQGQLKQNVVETLKTASPEERYRHAAAFALGEKVCEKVEQSFDRVTPSGDKAKIVQEIYDSVDFAWLVNASEDDLDYLIREAYSGEGEGKSKEGEEKEVATTHLGDKASPRHTRAETSENNSGASAGFNPRDHVWDPQFTMS
jgi:hypothetical protein